MFDWKPLLEKLSKTVIDDDKERGELSPKVKASGWLGFAGASEDQIRVAETRLGVTFPPSYREFLALSNGWRRVDHFIDGLYPVEGVNWTRLLSEDLLEAWEDNIAEFKDQIDEDVTYTDQPVYMMEHYFRDTLQISDYDDAIIFLNPNVITQGGEWEAWFFANWNPGANRFPSFWALMEHCLDSTVSFQAEEAKRYQLGDDLHAKLPNLIEALHELINLQKQIWGNQAMPLPWDTIGATQTVIEEAIHTIESFGRETTSSNELLHRLRQMMQDYQKKAMNSAPKFNPMMYFRLMRNINAANDVMEQHARQQAYQAVMLKLQWFLGGI